MSTIKAGPNNDHKSTAEINLPLPERIFGIRTEAIIRLGELITPLHVLPPKIEQITSHLPDALTLLPLIEKVHDNTIDDQESIKPYIRPIKKIIAPKIGAFIFNKRFEGYIDARISKAFKTRAPEALQTAYENVKSVEDDVEFIANFENPKEQFTTEFNNVNQQLITAINEAHQERVEQNSSVSIPLETPSGILGIAVKIYRKLKSFFNLFKQPHKTQEQVTASDAGEGIYTVLNNLRNSSENTPLFRRMIFDRLPASVVIYVSPYKLALIAEEILTFMNSLSDDEEMEDIKRSIIHNPHELRFITAFKQQYGKYSLSAFQKASKSLAPAIRDILPSLGSDVTAAYNEILGLLNFNRSASDSEYTVPTVKIVKDVIGKIGGTAQKIVKFLKRSKK